MRHIATIAAAAVVATLSACQSTGPSTGPSAKLEPRSGSGASGTVAFRESGDTLMITASITGLKPNAEHGFHVHETGDCSAADATSAGGHFNPGGTVHGHRGGAHHAGDLPNIRADANGNARYEAWVKGLALRGPQGIVGRGIVLHRDPDDYRSQPAGNSGPRIACGVISG